MKTFATTTILSLALALVVSQARAQTKNPHGFSCYLDQKVFDINFDGGRFADWISITDYSSDILKPLMHPGEEKLQLGTGSLDLALQMGACRRGTGNVLVECDYDTFKGFSRADYTFSYVKKDDLNPGFTEGLTVQRSINLETLHLKVVTTTETDPLTKQARTIAKMQLSLVADAAQGSIRLNSERRLGEWTDNPNRSNYDRCVFE